MKRAAVVLILGLAAAASAQPAAKPGTTKVLGIADVYLREAQKSFSDTDRVVYDSIVARLLGVERSPVQVKVTIESLANQLTGALASMKSPSGLTAASALLVKLDPENPRVTNLFGAVLHSTARSRDAAKVLELTHAQSPASTLAQLNLANAYLDVGRDTAAKRLADLVVKGEPDNREAWKVIAAYWFRKNNMTQFQAALLKSSTFAGYRDRAVHGQDQLIDANEVKAGMSLAQMEGRLRALQQSVPHTTADLVEAASPAVAADIRAKYSVLPAEDRMSLVKFPQLNTNTNRDYAENFPVVTEWMKVFAERYKDYQMERTGISASDSEAEIEAKGRAMASEQMQKMMQNAQDAMKFLKGMPGVNQAQVNAALKQVNAAAAKQGVKLATSKEVDPDSPTGFDTGSVFAKRNYRQYFVISRSYEAYIRELFTKYRELEQDNIVVYSKKVMEEQENHRRNVEALEKAGNDQIAELKEKVRHIKTLNQIGDTYYKLWVNLYVPQYSQKMKPALEEYWGVSALYIRNMTDVEVIEREYYRVKGIFMDNAMTATAAAGVGLAFKYAGSTEAEEAALAAAIEAAEAKAKVESVVFLRDLKVPRIRTMAEKPGADDWIFWTGQKFDYAINGQFLSLHVTSRSIEFEAWAMGPAAGIKVQFDEGHVTKVDSYLAIQAKFKIGIQAGGIDLTAGGSAEFGRQTSSWDFENGKYEEGFPTPKGSLSLKAKAGNFDATMSAKYDLAKGWTGAGANANAGFGPLTAAGEIAYAVGKGVSGSGNVTTSAGPISAALSTEFDSQLRFQRTGTVTAKVLGKDLSISPP